jgi:hypothetical protein
MKNLLTAIALVAIMVTMISLKYQAIKPGKERWAVKTVTDKDSASIYPKPVNTTIAALRSAKPPTKITFNLPRFGPVEKTTWTITCTVREYLAEADGDFHLVLVDTAGNTMIGEIPNPLFCEHSRFRNQITDARKKFISLVIDGRLIKTGIYKITGIGYFDPIHGQTGVAPNGIELHPIINIQQQ